jgi:cytochrome c oxidase subunit 2
MTRTRVAGLSAGLAALLAAAVDPAAAQASVNDDLIWGLNLKLLYVAIPLTILVELILIYTVYRFKDADEAKPTQENRRLEITWTVATAIILLFVGFASYQILGVTAIGGVTGSSVQDPVDPAVTLHDGQGAVGPPEERDAGNASDGIDDDEVVEVEVVGQTFFWTYNYPEETVNGNESQYVSATSTADEPLVIPANTTVYLHVTSTDVIHALHVPDLGLKQDAIPGEYNTIETTAYETGTYQLYCAEYCGVGHSGMLGQVQVVSQEEFGAWLDERKSAMTNESG